MNIRFILASFVSLLAGYILGSIPVVNENLHWNLWFIVPISGFAIGMALGWVQFMFCFGTGARVTRGIAVFFAIMAGVSYFTVDYGIYRSMTVPLSGIEGVPDGVYNLSDIMPFSGYLAMRLESTTVSRGSSSVEIGSIGTTIGFIVDLIGAAIGAFMVVSGMISKYPYCAGCGKYLVRKRLFTALPDPGEEEVEALLETVAALAVGGSHDELLDLLDTLESDKSHSGSHLKIVADHRHCNRCGSSVLLGQFHRREGNNWAEVSDLAFATSS